MNILYIGDIMGEVGVRVVEEVLPDLLKQNHIDLVIAQGENVTDGKGISLADYERLKAIGIDFITAGNWTLFRDEIKPLLNDPKQPINKLANYPKGSNGTGKYVAHNGYTTLVISLLGSVIGRDADQPIDNPLKKIDELLDVAKANPPDTIIVNFHGDYSSEKVVIGQYLDGRVTAVIGDHWHVPTADARILPKGTAHISDVGMCGSLNSSLGVTTSVIVNRWRDGYKMKNHLDSSGPKQFNAVLIKTNKLHLATTIKQIQRYIS